MSGAARVMAARAALAQAQRELDATIDRLFERGHRSGGVTPEHFAAAAAARDRARRELRAALRELGETR